MPRENAVKAEDYFKDSVLFNAEIVKGKPEQSALTGTIQYKVTCKKCGAIMPKRRGNSTGLLKCDGCKRQWNRDSNTIIEPDVESTPKKVGKARRDIEESDADSEEEIVIKEKPVAKEKDKSKITANSIADFLLKSDASNKCNSNKTKSKKFENGVYKIDIILDYYDERLESRWHRFYLVKWTDSDKYDFVMDKDLNKKALAEFEAGLDQVERFKHLFKSPTNKKSNHAVRTKIDVLEEQDIEDPDDEIEEVEAPTTTTTTTTTNGPTEVKNPVIVEQTVKRIQLKVGQFYLTPDGYLIEAIA